MDKKSLHIHQFACIKQRKAALSGLFQTYKFSSLLPVLSSSLSYCMDVFCWCSCCYCAAFHLPSSDFLFLLHSMVQSSIVAQSEQLPSTTYCKCIHDLCRIYNGKQQPATFSFKPNPTALEPKYENSLYPVLTVKCCSLKTSSHQSTISRAVSTHCLSVCVCVCDWYIMARHWLLTGRKHWGFPHISTISF